MAGRGAGDGGSRLAMAGRGAGDGGSRLAMAGRGAGDGGSRLAMAGRGAGTAAADWGGRANSRQWPGGGDRGGCSRTGRTAGSGRAADPGRRWLLSRTGDGAVRTILSAAGCASRWPVLMQAMGHTALRWRGAV
jgi:hypothetical protein